VISHVVFGLFFSLTAVCVVRGAVISAKTALAQRERLEVALEPVAAGSFKS
jgi:hypothetical protein